MSASDPGLAIPPASAVAPEGGPLVVLRRAVVFSLAALSTLICTVLWARLLAQNGLSGFDIAQVILFALNFVWVSLFFWTALAGFLRCWRGGMTPGLVYPSEPLCPGQLPQDIGAARAAVLLPIYNEQPARVFANLAAMYQSLEKAGWLAPFDFFILSDTTDPGVWIEEEQGWSDLVRRLNAQGRIFYRKRRRNEARKSGNIADFCRRWGKSYEYMIVLDADSLIGGETMVKFVRMMQANPGAGIIQGLPAMLGGVSLYSRLQQFAARLYGQMLAAGLNFWQLGDGNYWGHNAILRTHAFMKHCNLPILSGKPPFGGHILSHDFVEAALMRRAGWRIWLVADLGGSYEESPPTLIDSVLRDRRWLQGNLQHLRLIPATGLHPLSRFHMIMGIMAYLASPLCLAFILTGLASMAWATLSPPAYFPPYPTLFPQWPVFDGDLARRLLVGGVFMLTAPKLLGLILALQAGSRRTGWGDAWKLTAGAVLEHLYTILLAPILMLFHSGFFFDILAGRDSGWGKQRRGGAETIWAEAVQRHAGHTIFGVVLMIITATLAFELLPWISIVALGLMLSIPLSVLSSRAELGERARRAGLFVTPEETTPPPEFAAARALERSFDTHANALDRPVRLARGVDALLDDPQLRALHIALLPTQPSPDDPPDLPALAGARAKLELSARGYAPPPLTAPEAMALLWDAETLHRYAAVPVENT
ncbi:MAG: glucans biosynthesis glucosyltransferase MdoH [Alphaproteobacteria bacterium]|nr:MAG: glucans biosynthesis glucosyltransferase MdoH [Alphaproteobacteria bacterium]